jgi:hypothetical protein
VSIGETISPLISIEPLPFMKPKMSSFPPEDVVFSLLDRDKLGQRFAALGDDDGLALGGHFDHDG